ncbi:unnamed protein product [Rotaria sp. Silwood1]|nr:unnamed protein product [Rotaria sp. Silwood1]CAF4723125.1 unnamed protein product [Rotaria sp. Silwood1]
MSYYDHTIIPAVIFRLNRCNQEDVTALKLLIETTIGTKGNTDTNSATIPSLFGSAVLGYNIIQSELWLGKDEDEVNEETILAWHASTLMAAENPKYIISLRSKWPKYPLDEYYHKVATNSTVLMLSSQLDMAANLDYAIHLATMTAKTRTLYAFPLVDHVIIPIALLVYQCPLKLMCSWAFPDLFPLEWNDPSCIQEFPTTIDFVGAYQEGRLASMKLIEIWREMFSSHFLVDLTMEECPMLIGIMRKSSGEKDSFSASQYEFKILLKGNILMHTHRILNLETLSDTLFTFKEEFDKNEQQLSFNFVRKTSLCWDIVLEIAKYLSLNDIVNIFPIDILPLLQNYKIRLPIIEPSDTFMKIMIEKIDSEQIVSLCLKESHLKSIIQLTSASIFTNIIYLILIDLQHVNLINEFKTYFSNLTCLSLCYNNEIDFHRICKIFNHIQNPIKRFEIHCGYVLCSHRRTRHFFSKINNLNFTIEYFLLDMTHASMTFLTNCSQYYKTCFLMTTTDFIKLMPNIRYVRLIANNINVEKLLDINDWKSLVMACHHLEKVTLKVIKSTSQDAQLTQNILQIQQELSNVRKEIKFHVISK